MRTFREAIFNGNLDTIRELATERPRLLQQSIDADGNTALGNFKINTSFLIFISYINVRSSNFIGRN